MHRLPQCHLGNLQLEFCNIHQVNQYDTPLSPQVFILQDIHHVSSNMNIQSDMTKLERVNMEKDAVGVATATVDTVHPT